MTWAEAFASTMTAALPVLAAIAGSVATFWFSEAKARREAREESEKARVDAQATSFRSRYRLYADYLKAVNDFGIAMNAPASGLAKELEIKEAAKRLEESLLTLELLASKEVVEPARNLRKDAFEWSDLALRGELEIGLPAHQFDIEKFELIELMRKDLEGLCATLLHKISDNA